MNVRDLLERLVDGKSLTEAEAGSLVDVLASSDTPDAMKGALLAALRTKGETGEELRGIALAMRARAAKVELPDHLDTIDTCGTGGDGSGSFNVSTAAAILLASLGLSVVKHGNRSVSSRCGSADVVETLGIPLATDPDSVRRQVVDQGFAFLFAPGFHTATASIGAVRRTLGVRTAFNLVGPLSNPAAPKYQLVGAATPAAARALASALSGMPIVRAAVVHGSPSWDEATPCGPFLLLDVRPGRVDERLIDPMHVFEVPRAPESALSGGDATRNAQLMHDVFSGARSPIRDAVLMNAAIALEVAGRVRTLRDGFDMAAAAIDDGRATWTLNRLARGAA